MTKLFGIIKLATGLTHPLFIQYLFKTFPVVLIDHLRNIFIIAAHQVGKTL